MTDAIGLWAVDNGRLMRVAPRQVDRELRLEDWIESHPDVLGERVMIIGRQMQTRYGGIIDLLAIDAEGRCVVIELKRGRTPRDIVAQALDYVSWVAELSDNDVREIAARLSGQSFKDAYRSHFGLANAPEQLNTDQRVLIVATDVDEATSRIVRHLTQRYGIDINVVALSYFVVGEQEMLARTWVVEPSELEERVDSHAVNASDADRTWTGLWHVNIGDGFLSAGQGRQWRDEISRLSIGDRVYAYLNGAGYVGGGEIVSTAVPAVTFVPPESDKPLHDLPLESQGWFLNGDDPDTAEYMVGVKWSRTVEPTAGVRTSPVLRGTVRKIWSADLAQTLRSAFG